VETWQDDNKLILINKPDDQQTFYSRRWNTTTTPDLAFCTDDQHGHTTNEVSEQLGGSDHRPIQLTLGKSILVLQALPDGITGRSDFTRIEE
jgi:hypothetical protein